VFLPMTRRYAWYVLGLLTVVNLVNYVDRLVIVGMFDDLRAHFHATDSELGLLWMAFFTVHALLMIPLGFAADRWDRRKILALGVIVWSLATLGSAYAGTFAALVLLRSMVGVGEAAYLPISNSLLSESFRPEEKARTLGIFNAGMFIGACLGVGLSAQLGFPLAFEVVAVPGLVLGVMAWRLRITPRRADYAVRPPATLKSMYVEAFRSVNHRSLRWMIGSGILISFAAGGYINWFVDFFIRYKGMDKDTATLVAGGITLTAGSLGVIAGGLLADRWQRRRPEGRTLMIAVGFFLAAFFGTFAILIDRGWGFFVPAFLLMFFIPFYNGPMGAVIDDVVDDEHAATAQATVSFMLHLLGTGPGGSLVGLASSYWGLKHAMLLPTAATAGAGVLALVASRYVAADMDAKTGRTKPR
jgi:MFS transporter, Spinster family, sphingosine-1-phosphate transporter